MVSIDDGFGIKATDSMISSSSDIKAMIPEDTEKPKEEGAIVEQVEPVSFFKLMR